MNLWMEAMRTSPVKKPLPILSFPGIQLINTTVRALVQSGELQAQCMKAIADHFDTAASVSNMDLSVEAEAFGARVIYSDTEVPTVTGCLIDTIEKADALKIPRIGTGRTDQSVKAIALATKGITDRPIFAGLIGPFSLAGRLMDMTEIMIQCLERPDFPHLVLEKTTSFIEEYAKAYKMAGANGIIMAEPAAGLLSPRLCLEFSSRYIRKIVDAVQDENFAVIYHNCGNTTRLVDSIMKTGADMIHLGNAVNLANVIDEYPCDKILLGNIDPSGQFRYGTLESISQATQNLLRKLQPHSNFIISSGCDIPPLSPIANIEAFFKAASEYTSENIT